MFEDPFFIIVLIILIFSLVGYLLSSDEKTVDDGDEIIFKSTFTRGGDIIVPQKLIFTKTMVIYENNHGLKELYTSKTTQTIPYSKLVGVSITRNIVGCNINIIGDGVQNIFATSFSGNDADKIQEIINEILKD